MALLKIVPFDKRLPAFSMVESIIAMVILLLVFSSTIIMYNTVLSTGSNFRKVKIRSDLKKWMEQTKASKSFIDQSILKNGCSYEKTCTLTDDKKFLILRFQAKDEKQLLLAEWKELIEYNAIE